MAAADTFRRIDPATAPEGTPRLGLRRTAVPLAALRLAGQGTEFAGFVLLARWLGTSSFGVVSVAYLIGRYAGLVADWGAEARGARDVAAAAHGDSVHGYVRWRALLGLGLAAAYAVVALAVEPAVAVLAVTVLSRGVNRDWWSLGHGHGRRAGIPSVVQGCGILAVVLVVHPTTVGVASLILAGAVAVAATLSVGLNRLPPRPPGAPSLDRSLTDPWMLVAVLANQVLVTADTLLLALLASPSEAGVYVAVYRLPSAWLTLVGLVVTGLVPGVTAAVRADPDATAELRRRILRAGGALGAAVVVVLPVAVWAVPVLFGDAYASGRGPVALLLMGAGVASVTMGLLPLVLALHRDRPFALGLCGVAAANLAANAVLIPSTGAMGAAAVTLASQVVVAWWYLRLSRPPSGVRAPR